MTQIVLQKLEVLVGGKPDELGLQVDETGVFGIEVNPDNHHEVTLTPFPAPEGPVNSYKPNVVNIQTSIDEDEKMKIDSIITDQSIFVVTSMDPIDVSEEACELRLQNMGKERVFSGTQGEMPSPNTAGCR